MKLRIKSVFLIGVVAFAGFLSIEAATDSKNMSEEFSYKNGSELEFLSTDRFWNMSNPSSDHATEFRRRSLYSFAYADYWVTYSGSRRAKKISFIGRVKVANCKKERINYYIRIGRQFNNHVQGYYKSKLGRSHSFATGAADYRWDESDALVARRARIAKRSQHIVFVNDFTFGCK